MVGHRLRRTLLLMTLFPLVVCRNTRRREVKKNKQPQEGNNKNVKLSNGHDLPLVGMGAGNLDYDLLDSVIGNAFQHQGYRMVDTNQASHNERLVANAIEKAMKGTSPQDVNNIVHVVTKVWYTHLGYDRTRLAVEASLKELLLPGSNVDVRVHMLIHWPRCDDEVEWMNCEQEERDLPQHVKDAGPPPHLDKENAWKGSWKALEDMYEDPKYQIASIGVSNFDLDDLKEVVAMARIQPHLMQGYVWTAIHDPYLMNFIHDNKIAFQAYSIMNGIVERRHVAPHAWARLEHIGQHIMENESFTPAQIIMAWFVQNSISVMPRASSEDHQTENSPQSIERVPNVKEKYQDVIHDAISALQRGEDMGSHAVDVTFINDHDEDETPVHLFWKSPNGEEIPVAKNLHRVHQQTFPDHVFVAYDDTKSIRREYPITTDFGGNQEIRVDLSRPKATFSSNQLIHLFWSNHDGDEVPVRENLKPGEAFETQTTPGHVFVAYDKAKRSRQEFTVSADYGGEEFFHIEL